MFGCKSFIGTEDLSANENGSSRQGSAVAPPFPGNSLDLLGLKLHSGVCFPLSWSKEPLQKQWLSLIVLLQTCSRTSRICHLLFVMFQFSPHLLPVDVLQMATVFRWSKNSLAFLLCKEIFSSPWEKTWFVASHFPAKDHYWGWTISSWTEVWKKGKLRNIYIYIYIPSTLPTQNHFYIFSVGTDEAFDIFYSQRDGSHFVNQNCILREHDWLNKHWHNEI